MDWKQAKADWTGASISIQKKWPNLTPADLVEIAGDQDKLLAKLSQRHGYHARDAAKQLKTWLGNARPPQPSPVATQAPANPAAGMPAAPPTAESGPLPTPDTRL